MRIAWFRDTPIAGATKLDETADAIDELGQAHEIDVVTVARAHEFVWKHFRSPYDLTLFEVGPYFATSFMRPYAFHYPGVAVVSAAIPRTARGAWLRDEACINARVVVVRNEALASALQLEHAGIRVRYVPLGVHPQGVRPRSGSGSEQGQNRVRTGSGLELRVAVVGAGRAQTVGRAMRRAQDAGARVTLVDDAGGADAVLALACPGSGESLMPAIAAMAANQPVVVFETESTADWPTLDPQTWRPRPPFADPPIAISIDPRDEEHSLALAIRRLADDAALRDGLATAGHAWWQAHATHAQALQGWRSALADAAATMVPPVASWLPDGTQRAREILNPLGATVDFLAIR